MPHPIIMTRPYTLISRGMAMSMVPTIPGAPALSLDALHAAIRAHATTPELMDHAVIVEDSDGEYLAKIVTTQLQEIESEAGPIFLESKIVTRSTALEEFPHYAGSSNHDLTMTYRRRAHCRRYRTAIDRYNDRSTVVVNDDTLMQAITTANHVMVTSIPYGFTLA